MLFDHWDAGEAGDIDQAQIGDAQLGDHGQRQQAELQVASVERAAASNAAGAVRRDMRKDVVGIGGGVARSQPFGCHQSAVCTNRGLPTLTNRPLPFVTSNVRSSVADAVVALVHVTPSALCAIVPLRSIAKDRPKTDLPGKP